MTYENRPLKAPRLSGFALRAAVAAMEGPLGGVIRSSSLRDMGVQDFRDTPIDANPLMRPDMPAGSWTGATVDTGALLDVNTPQPGFAHTSALDLARAYRNGTVTPTVIAERALAAIDDSERNTPALRIFISVLRDDVLAQAKAATARIAAGKPLSLLDGVPVAIKDEVDMTPHPTTVGTRVLGKSPAAHDATTVARWRASGAVMLGKTNMHECGLSPTGHNPHHGACRNPANPAHDPGGSSSGVAAAVAAGIVPLGLGADGGGSIRLPASHCGVVGLKPTYGRVSEHGAAPLAWSVGHLGPIGATALDAALGYALHAGRDPHDVQTLHQPDVTLAGVLDDNLRGVRMGIYRPWFDDCDDAVRKASHAMCARLVDMGATLVDIDIPELHRLQLAHVVTIASEIAASQLAQMPAHRRDYSLSVRMILALVEGLTGSDYVQAQRIRGLFAERFERLFAQVDVIVTPTSACTAPRYRADSLALGESDILLIDKVMRFVRPGNFLGHPAISFPAGDDDNGLPIGFQVMGKPWDEALLLRMARLAEKDTVRRAPQFHRALMRA